MHSAAPLSHLVYPQLPRPLSASALRNLFTPGYDERRWAATLTRSVAAQVALLSQLKIFQTLGRFLPVKDIPAALIAHVSAGLKTAAPEGGLRYGGNRLYRDHAAIRQYLGITSWGPEALRVAQSCIATLAEARTDPADLINAAVNTLVRERFELPALRTLRRLAGTAHRAVNNAQWRSVVGALTPKERRALETLLVVDETTQESAFAQLCRAPGRATRGHLKELIARHDWLRTLPDPARPLASIADAKLLQWANEARRLNAQELRRYVAPRRLSLLLALIRHARGSILDDLTTMLLKLAARIERKSEARLAEWYAGRHARTDALIGTFRDALAIRGQSTDAAQTCRELDALFLARGGREALHGACTEHLRYEHQNWRPFARQPFAPLRSTLLRLLEELPLEGIAAVESLLDAVAIVAGEIDAHYDYVIMNVPSSFLPRDWRPLVLNYEGESGQERFDRRQLEVAVILELADAIKAGEVFVRGSLSHDQFWERLPPQASDPARIAAYADERGWSSGADGFVRHLSESLSREAHMLDEAIYKHRAVQIGKDGRPLVSPIQRQLPPASALELERSVLERIPERPVLAALANTQHWAAWHRHFGLPSRLNPQIKDAANRYVLTAFAYGCALGPTQAARHFQGSVSADQLRFVDRRHIDITDLRNASADLINLYAQFELPRLWGSGEAAVADGTHFETYEDNLLAERHIRYGKTGGIAYRHIADNYIALFSYFIACGHYEAVYILDALQLNTSEIHPRRVHADTHGQSAAVFGLAYLLGIELMPRIRYWKKLRFYKANGEQHYRAIEGLFSGTIKWSLIREHYPQFMQLAIAIQSGTLTPSAVLARLNSYSTRNRFCLALQELGKVIRTRFLLQWIADQPLRHSVHKCTTKIERHHQFSKYLCFGGEGLLRSNDRADQEKAIVYNELITNAVALRNVVDQTRALHELKAEGVPVNNADLAFLSPYATSKLKRFGNYQTQFDPEPLSAMSLPG